ncbi:MULTISPECIES: PQQ-binding-like beta-propeller repeat protein [Halorussus]|uniref:outer membrane protein assembly factor BamB family protein n=1 Tax=Halorussus TaxID=1070314 RepID=UPI000E214652|nr:MULTISPECIES: PQQ-binding-like beta-propeller repeat protein [Halorussus]NHN61346.1 PQQ-binding-like beta-propeller repeat protein [Halorussus sp. JP-T4]
MPSSRRQFLAVAAAGSAALAGCTGRGDTDASFSPGTDDATEWRFPDYDRWSAAYSRDAVAPRTGVTERWQVEIPGANGRPVVADGTAFVPAIDGLVALDLTTGDELWSFSPSDQSWACSPTVHERTAYAGFADDDGVWALDAETGDVRWSVETRGSVQAAIVPSHNGKRVYAGDDTGRVYVVGVADGAVERSYDAVGEVTALATDRITVVVGTNGGQVYELYDDGDAFYPLWRRRVAGGVQDLAIEDGGSVLVSVFGDHVYRLQNGSHAGTSRWRAAFTANDLLLAGSRVVGTNLSSTASIGLRDGEKRWSRSGGASCAPAAAGDTFYVGDEHEDDSEGGYLAAYPLGGSDGLFSDGPKPRWKRDIPGTPTGGLTVADGALLAVTRRSDAADRAYAFDPT